MLVVPVSQNPVTVTFRKSGRKGVTDNIRDDANDAKFGGVVKNLKAPGRRLILCARHTVSWVTVHSTKVTSTLIAAM